MSYINPAALFIDEYGFRQDPEGIRAYADYLLQESRAAITPPVDLERIYERFHMPKPTRQSLTDVQGLLASEAYGMVVVNKDDPPTRQRFTEAHELMECLFKLLKERRSWDGQRAGNYRHDAKEQMCNLGAAELLMPCQLFTQHVNNRGVSFETARDLATTFNVSLTASLVRLARLSDQLYAVVLFRNKHKPSELKHLQRAPVQASLFGADGAILPEKRLRVEWTISNSRTVFVPPDKSVGAETSIHQAWRDGIFTKGLDGLELGKHVGRFSCESLPFLDKGEWLVLSLISFS